MIRKSKFVALAVAVTLSLLTSSCSLSQTSSITNGTNLELKAAIKATLAAQGKNGSAITAVVPNGFGEKIIYAPNNTDVPANFAIATDYSMGMYLFGQMDTYSPMENQLAGLAADSIPESSQLKVGAPLPYDSVNQGQVAGIVTSYTTSQSGNTFTVEIVAKSGTGNQATYNKESFNITVSNKLVTRFSTAIYTSRDPKFKDSNQQPPAVWDVDTSKSGVAKQWGEAMNTWKSKQLDPNSVGLASAVSKAFLDSKAAAQKAGISVVENATGFDNLATFDASKNLGLTIAKGQNGNKVIAFENAVPDLQYDSTSLTGFWLNVFDNGAFSQQSGDRILARKNEQSTIYTTFNGTGVDSEITVDSQNRIVSFKAKNDPGNTDSPKPTINATITYSPNQPLLDQFAGLSAKGRSLLTWVTSTAGFSSAGDPVSFKKVGDTLQATTPSMQKTKGATPYTTSLKGLSPAEFRAAMALSGYTFQGN